MRDVFYSKLFFDFFFLIWYCDSDEKLFASDLENAIIPYDITMNSFTFTIFNLHFNLGVYNLLLLILLFNNIYWRLNGRRILL